MMEITSLPGETKFDITAGESILAAALRANIPLAHACGGQAKCSTCRVRVLDGLENCNERNAAERTLSEHLRFSEEVRLACQTTVNGPVTLRRLVFDETDLDITNQLTRKRPASVGEAREVAVMFSDIRGFSRVSETLPPYDVIFLLNRYFYQMSEIIECNRGYVDKFIGDGLMAIFGIDGDPQAPLRAVKAALEMVAAVERMKLYFAKTYGLDFDIGIGVHLGEAVIGTVGFGKHQRLTAIGNTVNTASRIEEATKEAGVRLLISENLYEKVKDAVTAGDFLRTRLRGANGRITLYEIWAMAGHALQALAPAETKGQQRYGGRLWTKVLAESDLPAGSRRVIEMEALDLLIVRTNAAVYAMNNACPHIKLPLSDSEITPDDGIICPWHGSCFDLQTGEIRAWCEALNADGTAKNMEYLGNISKNRAPLKLFPARIHDKAVWVALDT